MSDTPTYASLLTRLFSGTPDDRSEVMEYLTSNEHDRIAAEAEIRDRLRDPLPGIRIIAAEVMVRVYGDRTAAAATLADLFRLGDPAIVDAAIGTIQLLHPCDVEPLLRLLILHVPQAVSSQSAEFRRWAAAAAIEAGPDGLRTWLELHRISPGLPTALLMGLADAAPRVEYDLTPVEMPLRNGLGDADMRIAAGAALWRVTWRVNRAWLDSLASSTTQLTEPGLQRLIVEVLIEHLGRRPDLVQLVRDVLADLAHTDPDGAETVIDRLAALGSRGWGVLIPMLHPTRPGDRVIVPDLVRAAIFREAISRPTMLPLIHHHAHGVIVASAEGGTSELVPIAARVLAELGAAAGMAVPDLLTLVAKFPGNGGAVGATLPKIAGGYPNAPAAIVRTLNRMRTAGTFGDAELSGFQALAQALAELDLDAGPALVENTGIDFRVVDLLLQQPGWKAAPTEVRRRHVRTVADALGSSRPEVRIRAAEVLRHFRDETSTVWPALVAVLAGNDEKLAVAVLPCFRYLGLVVDAVTTDLVTLFRETNPAYAARAVVALWRLGRMPAVSADLRTAVEVSGENGWGWTVLRGVIDRVAQAHGLFRELMDVFAASPMEVAAKIEALVNPPETPEEAKFSACVPRPDNSTSPREVQWDTVYDLVGSEKAGPLIFIALMCEYGSAGFGKQKIWLIKAIRGFTACGLAESKGISERIVDLLSRPEALAGNRHAAVRAFFTGRTELPVEIVALLDHSLSWYRWAGLELADGWELTPEQVAELTEDRVWDRSPRVRERALRMRRR